MLLKITGSLIVLVACTVGGFAFAHGFSRRPRELRYLQNMLSIFDNEVRYLSSPVTEAFERIASKNSSSVSLVFSETASLLRNSPGLSASEAWSMAVKNNSGRTALDSDDTDILEGFGRTLGSCDIEGQLNSIRITVKRLKEQESKAELKRIKSEAMYKKLGILLGLAIVVVLF